MQVLTLEGLYIYIIVWFIVFLHVAATMKEDEMRKSLAPPLEPLETPIIRCCYNNKRLVLFAVNSYMVL